MVTCLPHATDGKRERTGKEGGRRRKGRKVVSFQSWRHEKTRCGELETPCLINTRSARQRPAPGTGHLTLAEAAGSVQKELPQFSKRSREHNNFIVPLVYLLMGSPFSLGPLQALVSRQRRKFHLETCSRRNKLIATPDRMSGDHSR